MQLVLLVTERVNSFMLKRDLPDRTAMASITNTFMTTFAEK